MSEEVYFYVREYGNNEDWRDLPIRHVYIQGQVSDNDVNELVVKLALDVVPGAVHEVFWIYRHGNVVHQISFESWEFRPKEVFESTLIYQKWNDDRACWQQTTLSEMIRQWGATTVNGWLAEFDQNRQVWSLDTGYRRVDSITGEQC